MPEDKPKKRGFWTPLLGAFLLGVMFCFILGGFIPEIIHLEDIERTQIIEEQQKACNLRKAEIECKHELRDAEDEIKRLFKQTQTQGKSNTTLLKTLNENRELFRDLEEMFLDLNNSYLTGLISGLEFDCNCWKEAKAKDYNYACKCQ